ncbi:MAG: glycosyltransferase family 1 protein [Candidatus Moranbacteria bacterium]|nr:glycosyltransferase family 1 protein [Candidatus Moranbacteria bacterium]
MRIGIDARTILNPQQGDAIGSGHYTYQLIRHLLEEDKENEYVLFFDFRVREKDVKKFTKDNVQIRFYPFSDYKKYLPGVYSEMLGRAILVREHLDILHSTSPLSRIPSGYKGLSVTTFHNLGVFAFEDLYPPLRRVREQMISRFMVRKSDHIIAVSNALSDDLQKRFSLSPSKISVIHGGVDTRFFSQEEKENKNFYEKHAIHSPYVLFLGTLSPINNIPRLLEAFARFHKKNKKHQLVLAGKRDWLSGEYRRMAKDLGIASKVVFTGYVVGDDLVPLLKKAEFFIMPSLYEGFGSTVLEALATGTPTLASRVTSLPEIAGEAVHFFNPFDVEEMARSMILFASDPKLRQEYAQKGPLCAKKYQWQKTAQETLEVYKRMVEE